MATSTSQPKIALYSETVLVVEGDVLARIVLCEYLRHCGYRVLEAVNSDEALTLLQQPTISIDVVLTDINIAGALDGFALTQWIRQNKPQTDVIIAGSAAKAADAAANLCETGPMLARPYEPQVVLDRIKRLRALRSRRKQG
jgi:CheY-like chemotaxis protein